MHFRNINNQTGSRFVTIQFFRFILIINILLGHTYLTITKGMYAARPIICQDMSVDIFFIIAGVFMAKSFMDMHEGGGIVSYNKKRLKRLLPLYLGSFCVHTIYNFIFIGDSLLKESWSHLLFLGGINGFSTFEGGFGNVWYISSLFWMGLVVSAIIYWKKQKAFLFYLPVLWFITFSFMRQYNTLQLNSNPLVFGFFSVGLIKALCGLSCGTMIYFISGKVSSFTERCNSKKLNFLFLVAELFSSIGLAIIFSKRNHGGSEFLVYPLASVMILIFLLRSEKIFAFANSPVFDFLGKRTYAVYLTDDISRHLLIRYVGFSNIPLPLCYFMDIIAAFVFAYFFETIVNKVIKGCRRLLWEN